MRVGEAAAGCGPVTPWWRRLPEVAVLHVTHALVGGLAAVPLSVWMVETLGEVPGVDATLFDRGGVLLAEVLRTRPDLARLAPWPAAVGLAAAALVLGSAAQALLLQGMALSRRAPLRARLVSAVAATPVLVVAFLLARLAQGIVLSGGWPAGAALVDMFATAAGSRDVGRDVGSVGVALGLLAIGSVIGVYLDLFRAASAGLRFDLAGALVRAARALRTTPLQLWLAFVVRGVTASALLASAVLIAFRVGLRSGGSAALSLAVLEIALAAGACLRASWLGVALGAVVHPPVGTALPDAPDSSTNFAAAPR